MSVDLITLCAQILNLLILIWLLKKFLYKPVLSIIEARQSYIKEQLDHASQMQEQAFKAQKEYQNQLDLFEKEKQIKIQTLNDEMELQKENLLKDISLTIKAEKDKWAQNILNQKKDFDEQLSSLIITQFKVLAGSAFSELASSSLQAEMIQRFKDEFHKKIKQSQKDIQSKIQGEKISITVNYAINLTSKQKNDLKDFLINELDFKQILVSFKQNPNLICGIEIQIGEHRILWDLKSYLQQFTNNLNDNMTQLLK